MECSTFLQTDDVVGLLNSLGDPSEWLNAIFPEDGGVNVLQWAAEQGAIECLRALLDNQQVAERINTQDSGSGATCLHWACETNNLSVVRLLLDKGARCNVVDAGGETPIHYSALGGTHETLALLLEAGQELIDVQATNGNTALMNCVVNNHVECANLLIGAGANKELTNKEGKSAKDMCPKNPELQLFFSDDTQKIRLNEENRKLRAENERLVGIVERLRQERDEALLALNDYTEPEVPHEQVAHLTAQLLAAQNELDEERLVITGLRQHSQKLQASIEELREKQDQVRPLGVSADNINRSATDHSDQTVPSTLTPTFPNDSVRQAFLNLEQIITASLQMTKNSLNLQ